MGKVSDIDNLRIGLIIKHERIARDLTVDVLATHIGCAHNTLSEYENGKRPIPADRAKALAEVFAGNPVKKFPPFQLRVINPQAA